MSLQDYTDEQLAVITQELVKNPMAMSLRKDCRRYSRKQGEPDRLTLFQSGVILNAVKVTKGYVTFYEETFVRRFLVLNMTDVRDLFDPVDVEALEEVGLWALKRHIRTEIQKDAPDGFGSF